MLPSVGSIVGIVSSFRISDFFPPLVATPEIKNQLLINPFLTKVPFRVPPEGYKKGLRYRPQPSVNQWRKCMGIEPTWDSLHCPTPDLKSGSPTSELGTSGRFITKMANGVDHFWHRAQRLD